MRKIVCLPMIFCLLLAAGETRAQKEEKLFNGKNLSKWKFIVDKNSEPADKVFFVRDGVINVKGTLGYMYTKKKYFDYVLHVEWRWPEEATNSGIFILIEDVKSPFPNGIECQLAADRAGDLVLLGGANLNEYKAPPEGRPPFPVIKKAVESSEKPPGEWNQASILVKKGVITVYVNGVLQNSGTNTITSGHIGLQSEGKTIQFRNITLTELK